MSEKDRIIGVPVAHYVAQKTDDEIDDPEFSFLDKAFQEDDLNLYCLPAGSMKSHLLGRMRELLEEEKVELKSIKFELLRAIVEAGLDNFPEDFEMTNDDSDLEEASDRTWAAKARKLAIEIAKQDVTCQGCSTENCDLRNIKTKAQKEHREHVNSLISLGKLKLVRIKGTVK